MGQPPRRTFGGTDTKVASMPPLAPAATRPVRRRLRHPALAAVSLAWALGSCLAWPAAAEAAMPRTVRWTASPLKSPTGQPLPPAASYEVWLVEDAKPETLAATVRDTFWTLQARPGAVYMVRVRGISAQGQKSAFSPWSDTWRAVASPASLSGGEAGLGMAYPNPFNARTVIAYAVPSELPAGAVLALGIYDIRGHRLRALAVDRGPGTHEAVWDGTDARGRPVPTGVYLVRYTCGPYQASARVTLVA